MSKIRIDEIISRFNDEKELCEAGKAFLDFFKIDFTPITPADLDLRDFLEEKISMIPETLEQKIINVSWIGVASQDTFVKNSIEPITYEEYEAKHENDQYLEMAFFAVDVNEEMKRSEIAVLARAFNRVAYAMPVVLFIRYNNLLSLATCERTAYKRSGFQGEKVGKVTILRDINCTDTHRGHLDILNSLNVEDCNSFEQLYAKWLATFNNDILTKKFYRDLFDWYCWALEPESGIYFPNDTASDADDRDNIDVKLIRLITRLIFVWFIKQKGLVPKELFKASEIKKVLKSFDADSMQEGNYYNAILQNLFFATLNCPVIDEDGRKRDLRCKYPKDEKQACNLYRYEKEFAEGFDIIRFFDKIPYLNAGLFECLDKTKQIDGVDKAYYFDGFSNNDKKFANGKFRKRAFIPNRLFFAKEKGLISILDKYNFTVEENTPLEQQVALDPELLGKVFENLLGSYNPETQETARNSTGSFYTPREIVEYMVNESLIQHISKELGEEKEPEIRLLMSYSDEPVNLSDEDKTKAMMSLYNCKVLDPACGSGAFPMGMLQQMVHILNRLDPNNEQWKSIVLEQAVKDSADAFKKLSDQARHAKLQEIEDSFQQSIEHPDYARKLYLIENCIYGVDIQPIAMMISKLRFFISLICETGEPRWDEPQNNYGINTLPNLETKFVAANTLLDAKIRKFNEMKFDTKLIELKDELLDLRKQHFYAQKRGRKLAIRKADETKRLQISMHIIDQASTPDHEVIDQSKAEIEKLTKQLKLVADPKWEDRKVVVPGNLFDDEHKMEIIKIDLNKEERTRIQRALKEAKDRIKYEESKKVVRGFEAAVKEVTDWNPYDQNSSAPFFDIEWMFGLTERFDIVIGNPPYIQLSSNKGELAQLYSNCGYETFKNTGDIYCLFYERGANLLKNKGLLCYITSNKWMRTAYGDKTREFLSQKTNPIKLIDFDKMQIFESATVETNILLFSMEENRHRTLCAIGRKGEIDVCSRLVAYIEENLIEVNNLSSEKWVIATREEKNIQDKILKYGVPLREWDLRVNFGIKTGLNDAFIIDSHKREEILSHCKSSQEKERTEALIYRVLRGKDIRVYTSPESGFFLINFHNGLKKILAPANIAEFPALKEHLDQYKDNLFNRADMGDTPYNLRNCAYLLEFERPKILWKRIGSILRFTYDDTKVIGLDSTCFATGEHLEYLCCILNSKMGHYLLKDSPKTGTGDLLISVQAIEPLSVARPTPEEDQWFITALHQQIADYSEERDSQISRRIYEKYHLTEEEIAIIESVNLL